MEIEGEGGSVKVGRRDQGKGNLTGAVSVESVCSHWYSSDLVNLCHLFKGDQRTGGQSTLNGRKQKEERDALSS